MSSFLRNLVLRGAGPPSAILPRRLPETVAEQEPGGGALAPRQRGEGGGEGLRDWRLVSSAPHPSPPAGGAREPDGGATGGRPSGAEAGALAPRQRGEGRGEGLRNEHALASAPHPNLLPVSGARGPEVGATGGRPLGAEAGALVEPGGGALAPRQRGEGRGEGPGDALGLANAPHPNPLPVSEAKGPVGAALVAALPEGGHKARAYTVVGGVLAPRDLGEGRGEGLRNPNPQSSAPHPSPLPASGARGPDLGATGGRPSGAQAGALVPRQWDESWGEGSSSARPAAAPPPRIEVRIGRIELRSPEPPPAAFPEPAPYRPPRGFAALALARRHLDRRWY